MSKIAKGIPLPELVAALKRESENDFMSWVLDYAHLKHWLVHHTRPAWSAKGYRTPLQGDAGFFDLVLARDGVVILAELKSARGKLSPAQEVWFAICKGAVPTYLWRPADRASIEEILA